MKPKRLIVNGVVRIPGDKLKEDIRRWRSEGRKVTIIYPAGPKTNAASAPKSA